MSQGEPSRFWTHLGQAHAADLAAFGLANVKRHQALRYFTWRWSWRAIGRSEQMRFLLRRSSPMSVLRTAVLRVDLSDDAWEGIAWSRPDRWLYLFAVRLLWQFAAKHGDPRVSALAEPLLGNPLPVDFKGRLVSQDLANSALEIGSIQQAMPRGSSPRSILEVGAGYGRTAYALLSVFPNARYTIVDIQPALDISRWYLTTLFPARDLRFLSPEDASAIPTGSVNLAVSISSLQEMTSTQIEGYLQLFDRVTTGGTVFLKQWTSWRNPDDGLELTFDQYPVPQRWRQRFRRRAPVQTSFTEAAWAIPAEDP